MPVVVMEQLLRCEINSTLCVTACVMRSRTLKPYCITSPLGSRGGSQLSQTETAVWLYMVRFRGGDMGPETQSQIDNRQVNHQRGTGKYNLE